jgi:septal ring factor EnvC (AmiA/AmiB activator)
MVDASTNHSKREFMPFQRQWESSPFNTAQNRENAQQKDLEVLRREIEQVKSMQESTVTSLFRVKSEYEALDSQRAEFENILLRRETGINAVLAFLAGYYAQELSTPDGRFDLFS